MEKSQSGVRPSLPIAHYDPQTLNPGSLYTEPQTVYYDKPVVVMVNPRSISSGEGFPMMIQKLHRGKVVSFYGTNASFGMCSRELSFFPPPDDLLLSYEYGQNVPNPFSTLTRLSYNLPCDTFVELGFCDITGRVLQILVSSREKAERIL
ncbi:MAG: S41 family peptidase [Bacteroidales bacterium]|jgi:hypothetical protein|nr:S41 family peptidase [Bacteroidales bacterium]